MAVKRIRSTVDEREQKSLLMDLEVVMKSKGCPYIVMFNGAIFKVRIFRCTSTYRCWVAAHMCGKSHFRTCDVRAKVRAERVCELCVRCRCVRAYF